MSKIRRKEKINTSYCYCVDRTNIKNKNADEAECSNTTSSHHSSGNESNSSDSNDLSNTNRTNSKTCKKDSATECLLLFSLCSYEN